MKIEYERACIEAGTDEEIVKELRRLFDNEKKKMLREKLFREKEHIVFNSLWVLGDSEHAGEYELSKDCQNPEDLFIHKEELEILRRCLENLPKEDRELILSAFEGGNRRDTHMAEKYGMKRTTYISRKKRILAQLRKNFLKNF